MTKQNKLRIQALGHVALLNIVTNPDIKPVTVFNALYSLFLLEKNHSKRKLRKSAGRSTFIISTPRDKLNGFANPYLFSGYY